MLERLILAGRIIKMVKTPPVVAKETFKGTEQKPKRHHFFTCQNVILTTACVLYVFLWEEVD